MPGKGDPPAELSPHCQGPAIQPDLRQRKLRPGRQPAALVRGQVDLPVGPAPAARRQVDGSIPPRAVLEEQGSAEQVDALPARQLSELVGRAGERCRIEVRQARELVVVSG